MLNKFVEECRRNPFFWWGLVMFVLTTFSAFWIFNLALQAIVVYRLYFPILFVCFTIAVIIQFSPIRQSLRKFYRQDSKKEALFYVLAIFVSLYTDAIYFLIDPSLILGKLDSGIISNPEQWEYDINIKTIFQFLAIPFFYTIMITHIKHQLVKKGYEIHDKLTNNSKFITEIVLINTGACLIVILASIILS